MIFYVGVIRGLENVQIRVVAESDGRPKDLDRVRKIHAQNQDEAARKYVELITGGTAQIRHRN